MVAGHLGQDSAPGGVRRHRGAQAHIQYLTVIFRLFQHVAPAFCRGDAVDCARTSTAPLAPGRAFPNSSSTREVATTRTVHAHPGPAGGMASACTARLWWRRWSTSWNTRSTATASTADDDSSI